jgi:hypothetical protein
MSSPINLADRITAGLQSEAHLGLLRVAGDATRENLAKAPTALIEEWYDDVLTAARDMEPGPAVYWLSIAAALQSLAWER